MAVKNLVSGVLAQSITTSTTNVLVNIAENVDASAIQSFFPTPPFYITIMPKTPTVGVANRLDSEILQVTAVGNDQSGNASLTCVRGQRDTTAKAFSAGDIVTVGIYTDDAVFLGGEGSAVGTPAPWVDTSDIKNGAITTDKIANGAVKSNKIDWTTIGKSSNHYIKFGDIVIQWGVADFGDQSFSTDFWGTFNRSARQDMYFNYPIAFDEKPVLIMNIVDSNKPLLGICYAQNDGSSSRSPSFTVYCPKGFTATANVKIQWVAIGAKK